MVGFIIILFIFAATPSLSEPPGRMKSFPVVDALIPRLQGESWSDDERPCLDAILRILNGVKNDTLWATWVWDSMQPPVGVFYGSGIHFGSYDQCLNNPYSSDEKYCMVELKGKKPAEPREFQPYDGANDYLNTFGMQGWRFNHHAFGACVPSSCPPPAVVKFFKHYIQLTHIPDGEFSIGPNYCQSRNQKSYSWRFYAFSCFVMMLAATAILSTIYSYRIKGEKNSVIDSIANSFCMKRNFNDLFKVNKNEIRVLNGMRSLTSLTVIGVHLAMLCVYSPSILFNTLEWDKILGTSYGRSLLHMHLTVDTFFVLSGLLLTKGLLSGRQKNLFIVLAKRYIRLIGPYAMVTFYILSMAVHTGTGPIWQIANDNEGGVCEKYWWKNLFMISTDLRTMCFGVGWYVTCDFHLAILSVLIFWVYRRNNRAGVVAFVVAFFALTLQLGVMAYKKQLPLALFKQLYEIGDIRNAVIMNEIYINWEDRAGAYLVGMAMGWLITKYKPADYRNTISKSKSIVIVSFALYVMVKLLMLDKWSEAAGRVSTAVAIAAIRTIWAVAVSALIGTIQYGSVPVIEEVLGCSVFVPLSKLSYGVYLTHFFLLQRLLHTTRTPLQLDYYIMAVYIPGIAFLSYVASLILHLLVEAPLINISNEWLSEREVNVEQMPIKSANGTIYQNGKTKFKGM